MFIEEFAKLLIKAARVHEDSWGTTDPEAAPQDTFFDYHLTMQEATIQAATELNTEVSEPAVDLAVLLLEGDMTKALIWAAETATGWKA